MLYIDDLDHVSQQVAALADAADTVELSEAAEALSEVAERVDRSWSGSWLGYQSRTYYRDFAAAPAGAHFSSEWGEYRSSGDWVEYDYDHVFEGICKQAAVEIARLRGLRDALREAIEGFASELQSILHATFSEGTDSFGASLIKQAEALSTPPPSVLVHGWAPSGASSRDSLAIHQGIQTPPHIAARAEAMSAKLAIAALAKVKRLSGQAASHLSRVTRRDARVERVGTNVFIGHGGSPVWKDLKDFVQDRLHLPWDEFNRVPVAGVTNVARLSEMLDAAAIALLVMTGEDESAEGDLRARENVVHEAGLFQGRLGFTRAIILLEEGCQQFSNIEGLGQIRFPRGKISVAFEEIRRVFEREGLIAPTSS